MPWTAVPCIAWEQLRSGSDHSANKSRSQHIRSQEAPLTSGITHHFKATDEIPQPQLQSQITRPKLTMLMAAAEEAKLRWRAHQSAAPPDPSHSSRHNSWQSTARTKEAGQDGRGSHEQSSVQQMSSKLQPGFAAMRHYACSEVSFGRQMSASPDRHMPIQCPFPQTHPTAACCAARGRAWAGARCGAGRLGQCPPPAGRAGRLALHAKWLAVSRAHSQPAALASTDIRQGAQEGQPCNDLQTQGVLTLSLA